MIGHYEQWVLNCGVLMAKKLLIITNMGPKVSAQFQGQFVKNQVDALHELQPDYFYMRWHNDSALNRLLKYPVLWLQFVWRYVVSRQRFDLLHVHYYYPTIWLALTYRWLRNPSAKIVVTCHGSDIYLYKPESAWYKFAAKSVNFWIFTSEQLRQKFFDPQVNSVVLPAGIHPEFANTCQKTSAEKPIDLLYVGTLDHNKGMDRLLALLAVLPAAQVAVVGKGPYQAQFVAAAQRYPGLQLFSPRSPAELKQLYQRSKCFLSLSRNESFGLVMTEAMACYTPVIATETDGSLAQINDGENGYLLSQQHEAALPGLLAEKIQQLLSLSPAEYAQMQLAARQSSEQYLVTKVAARLQQLYQQL